MITVALFVVILSSSSLQPVGIAQPAPTGTAIQIVNPHPNTVSGDSPPELSAKPDGTDSLYHLVAWSANAPEGAIAEWALTNTTTTWVLGRSTERSNDPTGTFDLKTNLCREQPASPSPTASPAASECPTDGNYTLRVSLESQNGNDLVTDTMPVTVNDDNESPQVPTQERAETVEITFPEIVGELGFFFDNQGRATFPITGTASAGTTRVKGFYSFSPPGSEPEWTECASGYTATTGTGARNFAIKCTIPANNSNKRVWAVAVVANDTPAELGPQGQLDDSTDAHTIKDYYFQSVSEVSVTGDELQATGSCTNAITAKVTDQRGRAMVGVNVDVHAIGPADNLRFIDNAESQAPDANAGGGHTQETARTSACAEGGSQSQHEDNNGPDIKHIESAADGTDEFGDFDFFLYANSTGMTKAVAWADTDDDDRFCASEVRGTHSVTWTGTGNQGVQNPTAPGPEVGLGCTAPSPTPTGGGGSTATPTTSSTRTPRTDETTTTTTSSSTSSSTSTTSSGGGGGDGTRRVASVLTAKYRRGAFRGKVSAKVARCESLRRVTIKKRKPGKDARVGRTFTDRAGKWKLRRRNVNGRFYGVVAKKVFTSGNGTRVICRPDRSPRFRA